MTPKELSVFFCFVREIIQNIIYLKSIIKLEFNCYYLFWF